MSLFPHNVLDWIQEKRRVFTVKPSPNREDAEYLEIMSEWYRHIQQVLPRVECFEVEIDPAKLRKSDWRTIGDTIELLIQVDAYRLPYPEIWLAYREVSYFLTEGHDPEGNYFIQVQAWSKSPQPEGLAVCGMMVNLFPTTAMDQWPESQRRDGALEPLPDDPESNVGLHAVSTLLYESDHITTEEKEHIEKWAALHVSIFLSMLNTRGIPRQRVEAPEKLNRSRAKKKRAAILSSTKLTLPKGMLDKRPPAPGGTRASPRLHWRRGHLTTRHDPKGQWIRPAIVGMPENGMVGRGQYSLLTHVPTEYSADLLKGNDNHAA